MGDIYSAAELVIIAAAGDGPSYGLPGVSRVRRPQRFVKSGEYALVETIPNTCTDIQTTPWARRAWTYQEGHLARRRLVFTDRQVSFVCGYGFCVETLCTSIKTSSEYFGSGIVEQMFSRDQRHYHDLKYKVYLHAYTYRQLSFGSDALNAILGVMNSWCGTSSSSEPFVHLWGLKITEDWLDLLWHNARTAPSKRRSEFPTWTWAAANTAVCHKN
jgi:hypothetical protein